ncbi:MAG: type II toxin-antitoxin system HicB family antitoxin [Bacteroidales bacterium]|nr:type II toxin-antitoxin system HicB family antitoxin [Bacteroidales bacterium]
MGLLRYKGYTGKIDYSEEEKTFFGKVLGLRRDGIIFEGDSVLEIRKDFEDAIDQYLKHCKESGIEPEKPYNGKFVLRMSPELHGQAAEIAESLGKSMNEFINDAVRSAVANAV